MVQPCSVPDVLLVAPQRHSDSRGYFCEVYNEKAFREAGIEARFVQDNQSLSVHRGTIRGLHFQISPFAQAKLVRVLRGAIFDVAVDIRSRSPCYGKFAAAMLSADNGHQLFVPAGFAHGFCSLEPHTVVLYKVDAPYSREHERGLLWSDPGLGIPWPPERDETTLLERDRQYPPLSGLPAFF